MSCFFSLSVIAPPPGPSSWPSPAGGAGPGLFLGLGQPLLDGGALLPVQGHGGELLEGRLELILVLGLEEHIVVRGLRSGVFLQGIVDVILLRHRRKCLDVLLRDLDVGQGGPMLFELVQGLFSLV